MAYYMYVHFIQDMRGMFKNDEISNTIKFELKVTQFELQVN
jgi:hypothetical protein